MQAIIKTGGKQTMVSPGDIIQVEKIDAAKGDTVTIEDILFARDDENNIHVGKPTVENAKVLATVLEQRKGRKVIVFKFKRRKNYRRKKGHRQEFSRLRIDKIEL